MPTGSQKRFTRSGTVMPPLGLAYLKSNLPKDFNVSIIDGEVNNHSLEKTTELLVQFQPDLIGIGVANIYSSNAISLSEKIKLVNRAPIVLGGPYPSNLPENAIFNDSVDAIVLGEGEESFVDLCYDYLKNGRLGTQAIDGCWIKQDNGNILRGKQRTRQKLLDSFCFPDWSDLPVKDYYSPDALDFPMLSMITNRGCPYRCSFCGTHAVWGKSVSFRSVKNMIEEIERNIIEFNTREITFVDDVFTLRKQIVMELCQEIQKRKLKFHWFCNARADHIDYELAHSMAKTGCHQIYFGIESGSERILKLVNKEHTISDVENTVHAMRRAGIDISAGFIVGFPFDDDESIYQTIQLAKKMNPERLQFSVFNPIPETEIIQQYGLVSREVEGYHTPESHMKSEILEKAKYWQRLAYNECGYGTKAKIKREKS